MHITFEKVFPSGAWILSIVLEGQRISQCYVGYTKKESEKLFRRYVKDPKGFTHEGLSF